jgi:hypothetical protein
MDQERPQTTKSMTIYFSAVAAAKEVDMAGSRSATVKHLHSSAIQPVLWMP